MSQVLELFPARVPIGYANGAPVMASPEFLRSLQTTLNRLGGPVGPSTTDLSQSDDDDSGLEEFKAEIAKSLNALEKAPQVVFEPYSDPMHPLVQAHSEVQQLQTELAGLREEVAALRTLINDLQQGTSL